MKRLKFLAYAATLIAAVTLTFSACNNEDDGVGSTVTPESGLVIGENSINFTVNGGTNSVTVTGNAAWTPVVAEENAAWLTATRSGSQVEITVTSNVGNGLGRSGSVAIADLVITVTQDRDTTVPGFWIYDISKTINSDAQEVVIATGRQGVSNYIFASSVNWFSASQSGDDIVINVLQNDGARRSGTLTVTVPELPQNSVTITITQGRNSALGYEPIIFNGDYSWTSSPTYGTVGNFTGTFATAQDASMNDLRTGATLRYSYMYSVNSVPNSSGFPLRFYYDDNELGITAVPAVVYVDQEDGVNLYLRTMFMTVPANTLVEGYIMNYDEETKTLSATDTYQGQNIGLIFGWVNDEGTLRYLQTDMFTNVRIQLDPDGTRVESFSGDVVETNLEKRDFIPVR